MDKDFFIIWKMKNGDETAMNQFVEQYYEKILNYCHYHCYDRESARDLTQDTFMRFFSALADFHPIGKSVNYLYVIARNLCIDYGAKKKELLVAQVPDDEGCGMEHIEDKLDIACALSRLNEELRECVILRYFQGLSVRETAAVLQIGQPLVKYRIRRAKEQLGILLGRDGMK